MKRLSIFVFLSILAGILACGRRPTTIRSFPLNSAEGIIDKQNVILDEGISTDGRGSLRIEAREPITVHLFSLTDLKTDNARLTYTAQVRTKNVIGQVYLEMIGYFPTHSEVIARGQEGLVSGTTDWGERKTWLDLSRGDRPDSVTLNLQINGHGTAWIDDIKLMREALSRQKSPPIMKK
jgi:hypothetical protein